MEVKMNKEIRDYQESMFMGLDLRQCVCSVLAILTAIGIYFGMRDITGQEVTGWLCVIGAAPFAACGFFRAVFVGSNQIRTSVSEKTGVSVGRSLPFLYAGDHLAGRKEPKGWSRNFKRTGTESRSKTGKETKGKE